MSKIANNRIYARPDLILNRFILSDAQNKWIVRLDVLKKKNIELFKPRVEQYGFYIEYGWFTIKTGPSAHYEKLWVSMNFQGQWRVNFFLTLHVDFNNFNTIASWLSSRYRSKIFFFFKSAHKIIIIIAVILFCQRRWLMNSTPRPSMKRLTAYCCIECSHGTKLIYLYPWHWMPSPNSGFRNNHDKCHVQTTL